MLSSSCFLANIILGGHANILAHLALLGAFRLHVNGSGSERQTNTIEHQWKYFILAHPIS